MEKPGREHVQCVLRCPIKMTLVLPLLSDDEFYSAVGALAVSAGVVGDRLLSAAADGLQPPGGHAFANKIRLYALRPFARQ